MRLTFPASLLSCVALAATAFAQTGAEPAPVTPVVANPAVSLLRGGEIGELLAVYLPRNENEIQRLLEAAQSMKRSADADIDGARRLATEAESRARIIREELSTTKERLSQAKKAKATGIADLESTLKRQSREQDYLVRLRDALRADADRLESEQAAATARLRALDLELTASRRYAELSGAAATPEAVGQYQGLLKNLLGAQREAADRMAEASAKGQKVAMRRQKQLEALSRISR